MTTFKERDLAAFEKYRLDIRMMMATAGIGGVLEILADITQEYGDGAIVSPDAFWLNAAAQIDDCKEKIQEII